MSDTFVSNEEYMERWEKAAPTAVHTEMTPEEIAKMQGTRTQDTNPWESYDQELELAINDPILQEAIKEYEGRISDAEASNQSKEELARVREASMNAAEEYQWVKPEEYRNAGERIGHIMHSDVFIHKLREAGVKCWYRTHPQPRKITLIVQVNNETPNVGCWVQLGFMPELSVMRFDDHGVPLDEKYRGWRTCLLQLILHGVITQQKAEDVFGKPPVTPAFHRYNATLQRFRSSGSKLV
jgi:hypothetical protein